MIGTSARAALSEEIEFLRALQGAAAAFIGTSQNVSLILRGWKGTLAVLIQELEEMNDLPDDQLIARLQQEIGLNDAFLSVLDSKAEHPDAASWRAFFKEENLIAQELIKLLQSAQSQGATP
jgi:hypothetical protein